MCSFPRCGQFCTCCSFDGRRVSRSGTLTPCSMRRTPSPVALWLASTAPRHVASVASVDPLVGVSFALIVLLRSRDPTLAGGELATAIAWRCGLTFAFLCLAHHRARQVAAWVCWQLRRARCLARWILDPHHLPTGSKSRLAAVGRHSTLARRSSHASACALSSFDCPCFSCGSLLCRFISSVASLQ